MPRQPSIVDPEAGVDAADPYANRAARKAVEDALNRWGRFRLVQEGFTADLVIVVRKGNGKVVQTTIGGTPINGIPPLSGGSTTSPTQTTTRAGGRWGDLGSNDPYSAGSQPGTPRPQLEVGSSQDMFVVYRGKKDDPTLSPLEAAPATRENPPPLDFKSRDESDAPPVIEVPGRVSMPRPVTPSPDWLAIFYSILIL